MLRSFGCTSDKKTWFDPDAKGKRTTRRYWTIEQAKLDAIQAYRSQFDEERFRRVKHMVTSANGYHGLRCGFQYGELFALPHPVGAPDLVALVHGSKPTTPPDAPIGKGHLPMG